jgi:hypothetical protein
MAFKLKRVACTKEESNSGAIRKFGYMHTRDIPPQTWKQIHNSDLMNPGFVLS